MTRTGHPLRGPGVESTSGPGAGALLPAMAARFENDNESPVCGQRPLGAERLLLAQETDALGAPIMTLRLLMRDGGILPPLHIARESFEIIALWKGFGAELNLPLGLRDDAGRITAITEAPGAISHHRRGGSPLTHRRTRTAKKRHVPLSPFEAEGSLRPLSA